MSSANLGPTLWTSVGAQVSHIWKISHARHAQRFKHVEEDSSPGQTGNLSSLLPMGSAHA